MTNSNDSLNGYAAAYEKHTAEAKAANFEFCGCEWCKAYRQHEAQQPPEDVVERVAKAIHGELASDHLWEELPDRAKTFQYDCAKAAIAAMNMGDASTRKDEGHIDRERTIASPANNIGNTSPTNETLIDLSAFEEITVGLSETNVNMMRGFLEAYEAAKKCDVCPDCSEEIGQGAPQSGHICSEIRVIDEKEVENKIYVIITADHGTSRDITNQVMAAIRPYLKRESGRRLLDEFLEQPDIAEQWEEFKRDNGQFGVGA